MKKQSFYFFLLILIVLVGFNSCTIKKRLYQPGYQVEWHKINKETKPNQRNEVLASNDMDNKEEMIVENQETVIESSYQNEIIQEFEPIYASNEDNISHADIIISTKQKDTTSYRIKNVDSVTNKIIILDNNKTLVDKHYSKEPVSEFANTGFVLSIISMVMIIGSLFSSKAIILLFLMTPGYLIGILGAIISIISLIIILANPEKSGLGLVIASLIMPLVSLLLTLIFVM
jgi:hypothetical protein